jgi:hypothetical protein
VSLPESYYSFQEHMHELEVQHEAETWCPYERATGDKKWPVLCGKDGRYARRKTCDECKVRTGRIHELEMENERLRNELKRRESNGESHV